MRSCDLCGTKLPGPKGHGFPTARGGISCGRSATKRTNSNGALVKTPLPCAKAAGL